MSKVTTPDDLLQLLVRHEDRFRRLEAGLGDPWHYVGTVGEPAFASGWSNYAGWSPVRFRKLSTDLVVLSGLASGTPAGSSPIFTLPSTHRPSAGGIIFNQFADGVSNRVDVGSGGTVTSYAPGWVNLDGISFFTS